MTNRTAEGTIEQIRSLIENHAVKSDLSQWSVGMHLHHSLLASSGISEFLQQSEPGERKPSFSLIRTIVMLTGRIPRGRGKAPAPSVPDRGVTEEQLIELADRAESGIAGAHRCSRDAWWYHPVFGVMQRDTALKFIGIHNAHHLAIVADVMRGSR